MNQNASSSLLLAVSSDDQFWLLVWATTGGALVFIGLIFEKLAEWLDDRFLGGWKAHKTLGEFGWILLMVGILIEIADAGFAANEGWQTRQMAIKNDPLNQPIKSIKAEVYLLIRGMDFRFMGTPGRQPPGNNNFEDKFGTEIFIEGKGGALIVLKCREFESHAVQFVGPNETNLPPEPHNNAREYSLSFSWPEADTISEQEDMGKFEDTNGANKFPVEYWITRNNISVKKLDSEMLGVGILVSPILDGSGIISGSCIITFNGSIERRFLIPNLVENGRIDCLPIKNSK